MITALKISKRYAVTTLLMLAGLLATLSNTVLAEGLALGDAAKTPRHVAVPINPLADFNWKTRDDILDLRRKIISRNANLIDGNYEPNMEVFGAIEDKRPWWGAAGEAVYGPGRGSIIGLAEESRFLLNPFLLVGCNPGTIYIWDTKKISQQDTYNPSFPFFWEPDHLEFDPKHYSALARYNVTGFWRKAASLGKLKQPLSSHSGFGLIAYNARDFGFKYIYVDVKHSTNIVNRYESAEPAFIRQMIHCGGTCGYPGGCNNMSPAVHEIDRIAFKSLPARVVVDLWREQPESANQRPDFIMTIDLY